MPYANREKQLGYQREWRRTHRSEIRRERQQRVQALLADAERCGGHPLRIQAVMVELARFVAELSIGNTARR